MILRQYWQPYCERFNSRNLRERALILSCLLAALYVVWDFAIFQGVARERKQLDARYQAASQKLQTLNQQEQALIGALSSNPLLKKQQEIIELKKRLSVVDQKIEDLSLGLIAPDKLPQVIRELVANLGGVHLIGLTSFPPEPFRLTNEPQVDSDLSATGRAPEVEAETISSNSNSDTVGVYKHRVAFRLRAKFIDIVEYLERLEAGPWHFYWSQLDYQVETYPTAVVQLEAYTLSTGKGFIGE